jgi:glycine cleavage system transcriptional repressor
VFKFPADSIRAFCSGSVLSPGNRCSSIPGSIAMPHHAILAGIGVDRPGIVDEVSRFVFSHGCTIADSQLSNLRGAASFMMLISCEEDTLQQIRNDLSVLATQSNLKCELLPATDLADTAPMRGFPYRLLSRGRDQAGVVPRLSHLLRVLGVNIENLRIDTPADVKEPGFELNLLLSVPKETPISMLREYLAHLCGEIGISCELSPA